jgi:hypothetical protein
MVRLLTATFAVLSLCLIAWSPAKADPVEDQVKSAYVACCGALHRQCDFLARHP